MKFIFRRKLGEEHMFVLWKRADGKVYAVYEWFITILYIIALGLWICLADKTSTSDTVFLVVLAVLFILFDKLCEMKPWNNSD